MIKHFALQSYLPAETGLTEAKQHGYSHWYIDFSLASEELSSWSKQRIKQLQTAIKSQQVSPVFHSNYKAPLASDLEELRLAAVTYIKKEIEIAAQFNAPLIIHAGAIVEPRLVKQVKQQAIQQYLKSIKELCAFAETLDTELWLENLSNYKKNHPFYYIFTTLEEFQFIFERCDKVKFFLDIGHANIGGNNIKEIIQHFYRKLAGISISNNNGEQDQHLNLKKGSIDYTEIAKLLSQLQWQGLVATEIRDLSPSKAKAQFSSLYGSAA